MATYLRKKIDGKWQSVPAIVIEITPPPLEISERGIKHLAAAAKRLAFESHCEYGLLPLTEPYKLRIQNHSPKHKFEDPLKTFMPHIEGIFAYMKENYNGSYDPSTVTLDEVENIPVEKCGDMLGLVRIWIY